MLTCRCIIDRKQRHFDAESCRLLCNFAEVVVRELEKDEARVSCFLPPLPPPSPSQFFIFL